MEHLDVWLKFLLGAGVIVIAGTGLTRSADRLSRALGWGHAFAGFVILGWATSLPEVTISVSAVLKEQSAGLSSGNISGSIIFNLAILAILDLIALRRGVHSTSNSTGLATLAVFNLLMLSLALGQAFYPDFNRGETAPFIGIFLVTLYLAATLTSWQVERQQDKKDAPPSEPIARHAGACLTLGAVILLAGVFLSAVGDQIAQAYQLQDSLVGTIFLATVSSLPEFVTGLAAVRLGLHALAAGSILGSNVFNLGILGVCDLLFLKGPGAGEGMIAVVMAQTPLRLAGNLTAGLLMTVLALFAVRAKTRSAWQVLPLLSLGIYLTALFGGGS